MSTDFSQMGRGKTKNKYLYRFIHNVYACFFSDMLDYFTEHLYPRFEFAVMGTYDKAVEYITKKIELQGREQDMPNRTAIIMNPLGEFAPAEGNAGGKQYWRFPNLAAGLTRRLFDPIYQDAHVRVFPGFMRMRGEVELIMLMESFYEYCDLRMLMYNIFGGTERPIEPQFFNSFIILPPELVNYEYYNEYTGLRYKLDWPSAGAENVLVETTARNEIAVPVNIKPQLTLNSVSDASNRYGGTDSLADWRLSATINYEVELPAWLILESDWMVENIHLEVRYGSAFSSYDASNVPVNRQLYKYYWDWDIDATSHTQDLVLVDTTECGFLDLGDYVLNTRYYYTVTQSDVDSTGDLIITIPEQITNNKQLIVNSRYGELAFGDHYRIINNGNSLQIRKEYVNLKAGMIIELYVYKELVGE